MTFGRLSHLDVAICIAVVVCLGIAAAQTLGWFLVIAAIIALGITAARA